MKVKSIVSTALKFSVAIILISWMVYKGMLDLTVLSNLIHPVNFMIAAGLVFLNIFSNNIRWTFLLKSKQFALGNKDTLPLSLIGLFFNYAFPGGVGGDVVKGYYLLKDHQDKRTDAAITILLDRLFGLFGMFFISAMIILTHAEEFLATPELTFLGFSVLALFIGMSLFFALSLSDRVSRHPFVEKFFDLIPGGAFLFKIYSSIQGYRRDLKTLFYALILSLLTQFSVITFIWFIVGITAPTPISFMVWVFIVPLGLISTILPITPAGIGVGQAAVYYLYKLYTGESSQAGVNAFTAYQVILFCWGLVGVYFYLTRKKVKIDP